MEGEDACVTLFLLVEGRGGSCVCRGLGCVCVYVPAWLAGWLHEITRQRSVHEFRFSIDLLLVCGSVGVGGGVGAINETRCVVLCCVTSIATPWVHVMTVS